MNPERLAMLAEQGIDPLGVYGGVSELNPQDIAAAIHKLNRLETDLLYAKYAGGAVSPLWAGVIMELVEKWQLEARLSKEIADYAVSEVVGPNRCPLCKGIGFVEVDSSRIECHACEGTGIRYEEYNGPDPETAKDVVSWLRNIEINALEKVVPLGMTG